MTYWGRAITFFPLFHISLIIGTGVLFICNPTWIAFLLVIFILYVFPLLIFRLHNKYIPLKEGKSRLDTPTYSPWWTAYHFQVLFNTFSCLEAFLRLIPGAYSFWLRRWGSKIGRNVQWTPLVEIVDRSLIEVGDRVIFGHKVIIVSHVITRKESGMTVLYLKKVRIGSNVFVGAGSRFGPGTVISPDQIIPFQTLLTINKKI